MSWIQTYTNRKFDPLNPRDADIVIEDIAHALSNICRFTGHVRDFYSVAEHSCHVSDLLPSEFKLWGLLHDASEAYLSDIARPVKYLPQFGGYLAIEKVLQGRIVNKFGLDSIQPEQVTEIDSAILQTEALQLMGGLSLEWANPTIAPDLILPCWSPKQAKREFMRRFNAFATTNNLSASKPELNYHEAVASWKGEEV